MEIKFDHSQENIHKALGLKSFDELLELLAKIPNTPDIEHLTDDDLLKISIIIVLSAVHLVKLVKDPFLIHLFDACKKSQIIEALYKLIKEDINIRAYVYGYLTGAIESSMDFFKLMKDMNRLAQTLGVAVYKEPQSLELN